MGIFADNVEAWLLVVNDVALLQQKHVENLTEEKKVVGWLEQADHAVITMRRHFVGLRAFEEETGTSRSQFTWYIGNKRFLTFTKISLQGRGNSYVCAKDRLYELDPITGSGWEEQTWECISKFVPVLGSYYEETVTEAPAP